MSTIAEGKEGYGGSELTFSEIDQAFVRDKLLLPGEHVVYQSKWDKLKKSCCGFCIDSHLAHITVVTNQRVILAAFNQHATCAMSTCCMVLPEDVTSFRLNDVSSARTSSAAPRLGWLLLSFVGVILLCLGIMGLAYVDGAGTGYLVGGLIAIPLGMLLTYLAEDDPTFLILEMHGHDITAPGFIAPFLQSIKIQKNKCPLHAADAETVVNAIMGIAPEGSGQDQTFTMEWEKLKHEVVVMPQHIALKTEGPSALPCCNVKKSCQVPMSDYKVIRRRDVQSVRVVREAFNWDVISFLIWGFIQVIFGSILLGSPNSLASGIGLFLMLWGLSNLVWATIVLMRPLPPNKVIFEQHGATWMQGTLTQDVLLLPQVAANKIATNLGGFGGAGSLFHVGPDGPRMAANMVYMPPELAYEVAKACVAHESFV